jgi:hypothetical protein
MDSGGALDLEDLSVNVHWCAGRRLSQLPLQRIRC